jgi:hypothetical protein
MRRYCGRGRSRISRRWIGGCRRSALRRGRPFGGRFSRRLSFRGVRIAGEEEGEGGEYADEVFGYAHCEESED